MTAATIHVGDCRAVCDTLERKSARVCVTSPPYWGLRDYGVGGQIGLESTLDEYLATMVDVFRRVREVLTDDGTLWLNVGDCYRTNRPGNDRQDHSGRVWRKSRGAQRNSHAARVEANRQWGGLRRKNLVGVPWRLAFALQDDGWILRSDVVWHKTNPMPESVKDRPSRAHEFVFLFSKRPSYYYDADAVRTELRPKTTWGTKRSANGAGDLVKSEGFAQRCAQRTPAFGEDGEQLGAQLRTVWSVGAEPTSIEHFAVMPTRLVEPCVLAGSQAGDLVFDPFCGAGTVGLVACRHERHFVGAELSESYARIARRRIADDRPLFTSAELVLPSRS